ncbi:DUF2970 domain-containing protein [Solimonas soli]|uniref:DUF2970 domain-containing protein n=1 Tax=Solimonas soli TaxID=413479 RepID=UPI0004AFFAD1|nr:DUF2970 domain-containing protein [Solimonas soli]
MKSSATPRVQQNEAPPRKVGLLATVGSVLMAMFGVQSSKARERDFSRGSPALFIGIGIAMTVLFIVVLVSIVRLLLRRAGL